MNNTPSLWTGRVLTGLAILFWLMDGGIKLIPIPAVMQTLEGLGFHMSIGLARGLGVLQLACLALYIVPRTSLVGAILLTGFLGGAIAVNLRAETPLFSHILFGVYVGLVTWAGLLLRHGDARRLLFGGSTPVGRSAGEVSP
jgi:hypothetical protein